MKVAIMQPYLFSYLGYFQLIAAVDKFVILDDVNFINKGWINRNRILINGKPSMFTLPLEQASQNKLIKDILVAKDKRWTNKFLKSIEMAYKKAPYFEFVFPLIKDNIEREETTISDLIYYGLVDLCKYMGIGTEIVPHSALYHTEGVHGQDKILEICVQAGATQYINPLGGQDLYTKEKFLDKNIQINFLSPELSPYPQNSSDFVAGLSIIDVLMNNNQEQIQYHLNNYKLL
jgi:hypothetical protein